MGKIISRKKVLVCLSIFICLSCALGNVIVKDTTCNKTENKREEKRWEVRKDNFERLLTSAERWKDVRELTGNNDHPMITRAMRLCGLDGNKGYAWCAACQSDIHEHADLPNPRSARVVEWFEQNVVWIGEWGEKPEYMDVRGMVGGIYNNRLKRLAHIVLIVGESDKYYYTIEGNTSAIGAIEWDENIYTDDITQFTEAEREGDGFYKKIRDKRIVVALADYCLNGKMFIEEYDYYLQKFLE